MKKLLLISSLLVLGTAAIGQVKIGTNPNALATNANLQVEGTAGEQFTVLKNGNVGIGTIAPTERLNVLGNFTLTGQIIPSSLGGANITIPANRRLNIGAGGNAANEAGAVVTLASVDNTQNIMLSLLKTGKNTAFIGNAGNGLVIGSDGPASAVVFKTSLSTTATNILDSGKETMRIANNGNVGIGTSDPVFALDIINPTGSSNSPFIRIGNTAGGGGNKVGINLVPFSARTAGPSNQIISTDDGNGSAHLSFWTAPTGQTTTSSERMTILNNGNVGIGNSGPAVKLDVNGVLRVSSNGTANAQGTQLTWNDPNLGTSGIGMSGFLNHRGTGGGGFVFSATNDNTTFNEFMRINGNGNVGIGTNAPTSKLDVVNNAPFNPGTNDLGAIKVSGTYGGGIVFAEGVNRAAISAPFGSRLTFSTGGTVTGGTEKMTIMENGNVGIGTGNPVEKLHVDGNARIEGIVRLTNGGTFPDAQGTQFAYNNTQLDGEARGKSTFLNHRGDISAFNYGGFIFATASSGVAAKKVLEIDRDGNITQSATGYFKVATGTTDERPPAAFRTAGMIRFNTTLNKFEGFDGTAWQLLN